MTMGTTGMKAGEIIITFIIALLCFTPLVGVRIFEDGAGLALAKNWPILFLTASVITLVRIALNRVSLSKTKAEIKAPWLGVLLLLGGLALPFLPFTDRYLLDTSTMVLTYVVLAWGLNITIGKTGQLDLGYVAFYAIGAYSYALLALNFDISFWLALPLVIVIAVIASLIVGIPTLRLRGDYFAIATLGFAEIVRILLINMQSITGGPNGLTRVPRPDLFGLTFDRASAGEGAGFAEFFGLDFDPMHRVIFLYYLILAILLVVLLVLRFVNRLPYGRAMEAVREDEIAAVAVGINVTRIKLFSYGLAAAIGAIAGAFFAARQGFVSPESFSFMETAMLLAIVLLAGAHNPLGAVLAAIIVVGMPELFRELQDYRMLVFGLGMVLLMIIRPGGIFATRRPVIMRGGGE